LQETDPEGYKHSVTLHEGKGHWMNLEDRVAVPWMSAFTRQSWPSKVVWIQDDVLHQRFYWLQVDPRTAKAGDQVTAEVQHGKIRISVCSAANLTLLLNDRLLSLDSPISVEFPDGATHTFSVQRKLAVMATGLLERNDPAGVPAASVTLAVPVRQ
jgi:hypothetical protein